jgi:hypothetical protein
MADTTLGPYYVGSMWSCTDRSKGWKGHYTIRLGEQLIHFETLRKQFPDSVEASRGALEIGMQHAQRLIDEAAKKA